VIRRNVVLAFLQFIVVVVVFTAGGAAQAGRADTVDEVESSAPEVYGLESNLLLISAEEFECNDDDGDCAYRDVGAASWNVNGMPYSVSAAVNLPSGALVTGMRVFYGDYSADHNINVALERIWHSTTVAGVESVVSYDSAGSPGHDEVFIDISPDLTILQRIGTIVTGYVYQWYRVRVYFAPTLEVKLRAVGIHWQRQVSAAPGTASFNDVPTGHWAFRHIEALSASGITAGCGGGSFCPDTKLTRAEMAVFLAKALGLHYGP